MEATPSTTTSAPLVDSTMEDALAELRQACPLYETTAVLDELRSREYARLDGEHQVYLDYTGGGLYAESQLREHMALLSQNVFGNPHSENPTSLAMTHLVEQARAYVLEFFNASPDEYVVIFTPNASGALKLVGEAYPFQPGDHYLLTFDNHNSVNGIREYARARGAAFTYLPVVAPDLRVDPNVLDDYFALGKPGAHNLFAFPAQSNFSGVQHPLELIAHAREQGWDVLVDCAAFAPTNRLDLDRWLPDYATFSFYKMFGYPTGVGCLIARRAALRKLKRPWYAGGTITISSVQGDGHYLAAGEAGFEDGTINYLSLPAVEIGLRHLASIGMDTIHNRVVCLTGWLIRNLLALHHRNGNPLVRLHGPQEMTRRGGTVTVTFLDPNGQPFDDKRIEEMANRDHISLRTGCFCNPGAGEVAHGLCAAEMKPFFKTGHPLTFAELRDLMRLRWGKSVSAVRVSVGMVSNLADVYAFVRFARGFCDRTVEQVGPVQGDAKYSWFARDST